MKLPTFIMLLAHLTCALPAAGTDLQPLMLVPDKVLYRDDFDKAHDLDKDTWRGAQGTQWKIEDGVLRGQPSTPEFQSSHKTHKGLEPRGALVKCPASYIVATALRMIGGKAPQPLPSAKSVPWIDFGHHVGRVEFGAEGARLLADAATLQVAGAPDFKLEDGRWYDVMLEVRDDEVTMQIAGGPTLHGKHPTFKGATLPAESSHTFAVVGREGGTVELDKLTLWSVKDGVQPTWMQTLANLPAPESKVVRPKRPGQLAKEKKDEEK